MIQIGGSISLQNCVTVKRNVGLDFLRYIGSLMVICIHMPYFGKVYLEPFTRFAVPFFFMVTGYFYESVCKKGTVLLQIKKIFWMCVYASLIYVAWHVLSALRNDGSVGDYLHSLFHLKSMIRLVCFNGPYVSEHLWYLFALLYVLVVKFIIDCLKISSKWNNIIIVSALFINILFGNYSTVIFGFRFPLVLTRNFLFMGLPFFMLGELINRKRITVDTHVLMLMVIISICITAMENLFLLSTDSDFNADCFVSTPVLTFALFLLALQSEEQLESVPYVSTIAQLGKRTSATIYIIHPIIMGIVGKIVSVLSSYIPVVSTIYYYIGPIVIIIICTILGCLVDNANKYINAVFCK